LAYLLLHRDRTHRREVIADTFWGDTGEQRARNCLNTALWRLRRVLEPNGVPRGAYLTTTGSGEISFNWASDHWLDVAAFEDGSRRVLGRPAQAMEARHIRTLEQALALYTGELLEGFYDDWALRERERLRRLYLNSLAHLMRCHGQRGAIDDALRYGQRILELDPLREGIHREMMRLYLASGRRARVVRQYETCRQVLEQELGVEPISETQAISAYRPTQTLQQFLAQLAVYRYPDVHLGDCLLSVLSLVRIAFTQILLFVNFLYRLSPLCIIRLLFLKV